MQRARWTYLANAQMDKETRVSGDHRVHDPLFTFLVSDVVPPRRERHRERVCRMWRDGLSDDDVVAEPLTVFMIKRGRGGGGVHAGEDCEGEGEREMRRDEGDEGRRWRGVEGKKAKIIRKFTLPPLPGKSSDVGRCDSDVTRRYRHPAKISDEKSFDAGFLA